MSDESLRNQYELFRACEEKDAEIERLRNDMIKNAEGAKAMQGIIERQSAEIERLRAALLVIAEDDIYLRNCATWHDTGKMKTGVQAFARAALENK